MLTLEDFQNRRKAALVLQNGTIFWGTGFGATGRAEGELVFTTFTAAGYYCALTDPSNQGQIYCLTYPLVGNYGVPPQEKDGHGITKFFESDAIKCAGFVVHEACKKPSHRQSVETLGDYLEREGIPGIEGIDTRELTRILREEGVQTGYLQVFGENEKIPAAGDLIAQLKAISDPNSRHLVKEVSTRSALHYSPKTAVGHITVIDCGVKNNILRELLRRNLAVDVVPFDTPFEKILDLQPDGVVISNGPGDPKQCTETIVTAKSLIHGGLPTMGICLGNQILCLAAGGDTYKLKYGHRGGNKPVIDLRSKRAYITSQNHGYAVDEQSLKGTDFVPLFQNADDGTNEGIIHQTKPIFAVQFHPEACPGPEDTTYLFDEFIRNVAFHSFQRGGKPCSQAAVRQQEAH